MLFNGETMTANFAGFAVPPVRVIVTQNEDGTYNADHTLTQILDAYDNGNAVYCQYGNMVLSLEMTSKAFCSFTCVLSGNVHTVQIGLASVTVTTTPVVKTVNGTAPDENGNVVLDISSGGGGGGGLKTTELIYELAVSDEDVQSIQVPIDIRKYEHFRLWIETNVNSKTFRLGVVDTSGVNYYFTFNGNVQIHNSAVADFSILSNDLVYFKGLRTGFRNKYGAMDGGLVVGPMVINIEASSLRLWREDNFKIGEIVRLYAVPWG